MSTKLVDMKYSKAEAKAEATKYDTISSQPEYPWGLCLRLEDDELAKLGIKGLPDVGGEYHLQVVAQVTSASQSTMADGKTTRSVSLQVTMIGIDLAESAADEKGEKSTPASEAKETRKPTKGGVLGRG